jgi:hypothetical protein
LQEANQFHLPGHGIVPSSCFDDRISNPDRCFAPQVSSMASRLGWTDEDILLARNRSRAGTECLAILEEPDVIANGHQMTADQGHTVSLPPGTARPLGRRR